MDNRRLLKDLATHAALLALLAVGLPAQAVAQASDEVRYYHTDAIGSVRMITDSTQQVLVRHDYLPFGERSTGPDVPDVRRFVGKERDTETGFDYFGARHYIGGSGRFSTVDPVMDLGAALSDPQRWNRYANALNNPLTFVDPDGRDPRALWMRLVQSAPVQRLINHPTTQRLGELSGISRGTAVLSRLNDRLFDLSVRLFTSSGTQATHNVWQSIEVTGGKYSGTNLPTQFNFRIGDSSVQVVANATKHIFEELLHLHRSGATPQTIEFGAQLRLASLQQAVTQALTAGVNHRELITIAGWELAFAVDKGKTLLIHAFPK